MKQMKHMLIPTGIFLGICGFFLWYHSGSKVNAQLAFHDSLYSENGSWWFELITQWGEAYLILVIMAIALYFKNYGVVFRFALGGILVAITVQLLKRIVFAPTPRPMAVIDLASTKLQSIEDLPLLYSFPSGHTSTAFFVFGLLALQCKNRPILQWACGLAAILVGVSRVYLMVHWIPDIMFGALWGITMALVTDYLVSRIYPTKKPLS